VDSGTVLLVDDEVGFLETLLKRLKRRQVDAAAVYSGDDALAQLESRPPDVVVLDVKMPGMDGLATLREIKKRHPLVEVIMLTGHADVEMAIEGMEHGAFDYLMKPCDIDELIYKIQDAYEKKAIHQAKINRMQDTVDSEE
jgi:DNA-binding NtrC family response regulator